MHTPPENTPGDALAHVEFDPFAVLERDSRILLNPSFLAALHTEIDAELGPEAGRVTLFQMGFLHGLQDASRALEGHGEPRRNQPRCAIVPPLHMELRSDAPASRAGGIEVSGAWSDGHEAAAHVRSLGSADGCVCHLSAGYTSGWLSGTLDARIIAVEVECAAAAGAHCRFEAREVEAWRRCDAAPVHALLDSLPFEAFQAAVREREAHDRVLSALEAIGEDRASSGFDRDAAAIHVWGPVMVLPYAGPDDTLRALDLIGSDPQARGVSVIVLDLAGAIVDEAFGALALEQIAHTAENWGTELIFAEPSALSERVIAELECPPLLVIKDLEHAIARAFQIAQSQRRPV